jgi:hypothetical protein
MDAVIQELLQVLNNRESGWVARRDAAENIGKIAHRLVGALVEHQQDTDMDVQMEIERQVAPLHVVLNTRGKSRKNFTLRDLAFACEKHGQRTVETYKTGFVITVKLNEGRSHRVYVMPHKLSEGNDIIRLFTLCGETSPEKFAWALRANTKLSHGAFSLLTFNKQEYLVIMKNLLKEEATPEIVKRGVKEMAYYGDWLEDKISAMDSF